MNKTRSIASQWWSCVSGSPSRRISADAGFSPLLESRFKCAMRLNIVRRLVTYGQMGFTLCRSCFFFDDSEVVDEDALLSLKAEENLRTMLRGVDDGLLPSAMTTECDERTELFELERERLASLLFANPLNDFLDAVDEERERPPMKLSDSLRLVGFSTFSVPLRGWSASALLAGSSSWTDVGGGDSGLSGFLGTSDWKNAKSGNVRRTSLSICSRIVLSRKNAAHLDPGSALSG